MSEPAQLTIDGREVDVVFPQPRPSSKLTPAQRAILQHIDKHGSIRSVEAGLILLEHFRGPAGLVEYRRRYASADGSMAMKRLEKRGLCRRDPETHGRWVPVGESR